jgi:hypothetical protein
MMSLSRFIVLLAAVLVAAPLRAHDLMESFIEAIVRPDQLELLVTMGPGTALKLIDPAAKPFPLTPENFEGYRAQLLKEGARLFMVTSSKARLVSARVEVKLTEEKDVAFKVTYPRPPPGLLIFNAVFLEKLGAGFGGIIDASDTLGHHLGWDQITSENPTLVVVLPAPGSAPK